MPVLLNVAVLLVVAVIYNYAFTWRRYPQAWQREADNAPVCDEAHPEKCMIPHSALVAALAEMDTFVDVSEADLQRIYALAMQHTPVHEARLAHA
jgi:CBS-domain-containing membrane protein